MKGKDSSLFNTTFGNRYFVIAISACLAFIFIGILLTKVSQEFDQADQAQYEFRLAEIKAAVRLMEASLISQGELQHADRFEGANPMDWMKDNTTHYLGQMSPFKAIKSPGNWFFDPENQQIAYVPKSIQQEKDNLSSHEAIEKILRFKVLALSSNESYLKYTGLTLKRVN